MLPACIKPEDVMEEYRDSLHKAQQFPGEYKIKVNPPL